MPSLERPPIGPRQAVIWHQRSTADRQDRHAFAIPAMTGRDGPAGPAAGPASGELRRRRRTEAGCRDGQEDSKLDQTETVGARNERGEMDCERSRKKGRKEDETKSIKSSVRQVRTGEEREREREHRKRRVMGGNNAGKAGWRQELEFGR